MSQDGCVVTLARYPVKSAAPESVARVVAEPSGIAGDREWAVVDPADGTVLSAKHPARAGRLLDVRAVTGADGVVIHVPDQAPVGAGTAEADAALSSWLGRPVRLTRDVPAQARLHRVWPDGLAPSWVTAAPGTDVVTEIAGVAHGRFVDFAPLHAVTTGGLAALARDVGAPVDASLFRPNLVLDLPRDPAAGERLVVGDTVLRALLPTPRCVVPSLARAGASPPDGLLRTLARTRRVDVDGRGRAACFGVYLQVERAGQLAAGDPVMLG